MRRILAFSDFAHAVTLDGLRQNDRRLAGVLGGRCIRRVDLVRIVTTAVEPPDVVVAHARHHFEQLRILAEKVLAHERAVIGLEVLVLAVDGVFHHAQQSAFVIASKQRIPVRTPDDLEHIPTGAAKSAFELLNDLAVAAHRTVEPLQIAVDDKNQVVELFARGETDRTQRLGLVHFTVTAEDPNLASLGIRDTARVQILQKARLIDALNRTEAHRHRRKLPKLRHQLRMRIRRHSLAVDVAPKVDELFFGQASFEESARVNASRAVALEVNQVAAEIAGRCTPEVIESHFHQRARRRIAGDVSAELALAAICAHHDRHRIPAVVRANALFNRGVAGRMFFEMRRNRVDVCGVRRIRKVSSGAARLIDQRFEQKVRALRAFAFDHRFECVEPLCGFKRVGVVGRLLEKCGHAVSYRFAATIPALDPIFK